MIGLRKIKNKNEKQAGIVTEVKDVKEQSSVKVQNVNNSMAENITCAETIIDSFKTEIHHHHYAQSESKLMSLDSMPEVDTQIKQQFESTFFALLDQHNKILERLLKETSDSKDIPISYPCHDEEGNFIEDIPTKKLILKR